MKHGRLFYFVDLLLSERDVDDTRRSPCQPSRQPGAATTGKAARKLKPLLKLLQPITILLANAKDDENTRLSLPAPPTLKRLEPPQLSPSSWKRNFARPRPTQTAVPVTSVNGTDGDICIWWTH